MPVQARPPLQHLLLASLLGLLPATGLCAAFSVNPVTFVLNQQRGSAMIHITNQESTAVRLQIQAFSWTTDGKNEVLAESDDLLFNPPILKLEPGQVQMVRFGLRAPILPETEKAYRLMVEEIPAPDARVSGIRTVLRISLPVFIEGGRQRQQMAWQLRRVDQGLMLVAENLGDKHTKFSGLEVMDGACSRVKPDSQLFKTGLTYVLPGQKKEFVVSNGSAIAGPLCLSAATTDGRHDHTLTLQHD